MAQLTPPTLSQYRGLNYDDPFGLCYHGEGAAAQANRTQSNVAGCVPEPGVEGPGLLDPVALLAGGLAGPADGLLAGAADDAASTASGAVSTKAAQLGANKAAGDAFRDAVASDFEANGYQVAKEVIKRTPLGLRRIDIEVSRDGTLLGGIETKASATARYSASQQAKDAMLQRLFNYPVQVVRPNP